MARLGGADATLLTTDIDNAVTAVQCGWPSQQLDTLCCGALGSVEFLTEAGIALGRKDLRDLASRRLMSVLSAATKRGDYRWSGGNREFNPGLFRGLAGIGYTALRQIDETLPNVLLWQ
jgi:lantibiotic modifying enzyme